MIYIADNYWGRGSYSNNQQENTSYLRLDCELNFIYHHYSGLMVFYMKIGHLSAGVGIEFNRFASTCSHVRVLASTACHVWIDGVYFVPSSVISK